MGKAGDFVLSKHSGETEKFENKSGWQKGWGSGSARCWREQLVKRTERNLLSVAGACGM